MFAGLKRCSGLEGGILIFPNFHYYKLNYPIMYIISLTYKVPLDIIDQHLDSHVQFLNKQYEMGNFHASGRKVPSTGGII